MAEPIKLRFADSTTADAPRSEALVNIFAKEIGADFVFEPYFGSTLYKQGTEIVAVQRGNLEMALMPPSDFAKQVPAFGILTAAYLVRDAGASEGDLRQRDRRRVQEDGARRDGRRRAGAGLLRHAPRQSEGRQEGQRRRRISPA